MGRKTTKQKRADENRAIRSESLRKELQAREYHRQIERVLKTPPSELARVVKPRERAQLAKGKAGAPPQPAGRTLLMIDVAKFRVEGYFKLMEFAMPKLKAVELSGGINVAENPVDTAGQETGDRVAQLVGDGTVGDPPVSRTH